MLCHITGSLFFLLIFCLRGKLVIDLLTLCRLIMLCRLSVLLRDWLLMRQLCEEEWVFLLILPEIAL